MRDSLNPSEENKLLYKIYLKFHSNLSALGYEIVNKAKNMQQTTPVGNKTEHDEALNIVLSAVAVVTVTVFVLVVALLLYVVYEAKRPQQEEEKEMDDDVFEEEAMRYVLTKQRSIPRVRFTSDPDD